MQYNESEEEPAEDYRKMIEFVGKTITPVVYNLIWYVINALPSPLLMIIAQLHHVVCGQQGH